MEDKCCICGSNIGFMTEVPCHYGYYHTFCQSCYKRKIDEVDEFVKLKARVDAIIETLSNCQRSQIESETRYKVEKIAFGDFEI